MKKMDARDKERDKKAQVAESARLSGQRKFEQDLAKRLEKLEEAQKAASSAARAAQETAGRAAAAAAQASTTQPASEAESGGRNPHTCILIAGFHRDTPRGEIHGAVRKHIEMSAYGRELLSDAACYLEAPYVLGSVAHFEVCTEHKARKLVAELRSTWANKEMQLAGRRYALRTSVMKTRAERERERDKNIRGSWD